MMGRGVPSWQLVLADLSLILFIATAGALAHAEEAAEGAAGEVGASAITGAPVSGSPVAVLRGDGSASDNALLAAWLADYRADPREQLTLTLQYPQGGFAAAQIHADTLRGLAMDAGQTPRIVLEEAPAIALHASFAFDHSFSDDPDVARKLQQ